jgi:hypothetical protein
MSLYKKNYIYILFYFILYYIILYYNYKYIILFFYILVATEYNYHWNTWML